MPADPAGAAPPPAAPSTPASVFARTTSQSRSEATTRRILEAALELFGRGELERTPVAALAARAGVSVGGFYGRFRNKADLQRAVAEAMLHRLFSPFDALFDPATITEDTTARELVGRFALGLVEIFGGEDRAAVRRVVLMVRGDEDLPTSRSVRELNRSVQQRFAAALLERRDQIGHPDPERAVAFADVAMSAAAREVLLFSGTGLDLPGVPAASPDGPKRERRARGRTKPVPAPTSPSPGLVHALTELGCTYLRIA